MNRSIACTIVIISAISIGRFVTIDNPSGDLKRAPIECTSGHISKYDADGFEIMNSLPRCDAIDAINQAYIIDVKPIFHKKCLSCHGIVETAPLYARIPPASWLVKRDIEKAKERMNMSFDFPFRGHGTTKDDLNTIKEVITKKEMPPLQYLIMHWKSALTQHEQETTLKWIQESQTILENKEDE